METRVEREGAVHLKDSEDVELGERANEDEVYRSTTETIDETDSSVRARIKERRRRLNRKLTCWAMCCLLSIVVLGTLGVLSVFDILSAFPQTGSSPSTEFEELKANESKCC